jgi:rhodanese-related sulfurtransferase
MSDERVTIADVLASARGRICRYRPHELAASSNVVIVDTRESADRDAEGVIPDSVWIPRTVLEWRADPTSALPDERIADPTIALVVVCNDGYSSSLAAASLVDIGFASAGDLIGGFRAWRAAGLPIVAVDQT